MHYFPRIKICGITRKEDALAATLLGVDALGFVFYEKSPRYIAPSDAAVIIKALPPFVTTVGLFVNAAQAVIDETLAACSLDILQFHGNESPETCAAQDRRVIKAIPVDSAEDLSVAADYRFSVLLDAKAPGGIYGGSGKSFDWPLLKTFHHPYPIILAGGLNGNNVQDALAIRQFYAVDVSSGVESGPGIKDAEKMRHFVERVKTLNRQKEHI